MNVMDPKIAAMFQQFLSGGTHSQYQPQLAPGPNISAPVLSGGGGGVLFDEVGSDLGGILNELTQEEPPVDPDMEPTYHDPSAPPPARPWGPVSGPPAPPAVAGPPGPHPMQGGFIGGGMPQSQPGAGPMPGPMGSPTLGGDVNPFPDIVPDASWQGMGADARASLLRRFGHLATR